MDDARFVSLRLPQVDDRARYAAAYWPLTAGNLVRRHGLRAPPAHGYAAAVRISPRLRERWHALYDSRDLDDPPYLYNQGVGTLLYSRLFADLGINFRHVRHALHRTEHACPRRYAQADRQTLQCRVSGLSRLDRGKALVELHTAIRRPREEGGELLAGVTDSFVILALPERATGALPEVGRQQMLAVLRPGRGREVGCEPAAERREARFDAPADIGRRYGRVAGDSNPVHTSRAFSALFGIERPFMQGLCLRNAVVRALAGFGLPLDRLSMSFTSPALVGQAFAIVAEGPRFTVLDAAAAPVALGDVG